MSSSYPASDHTPYHSYIPTDSNGNTHLTPLGWSTSPDGEAMYRRCLEEHGYDGDAAQASLSRWCESQAQASRYAVDEANRRQFAHNVARSQVRRAAYQAARAQGMSEPAADVWSDRVQAAWDEIQ